MALRDDLEYLAQVARHVPGAMAQFREIAAGFERGAKTGQKAYKSTHWGEQGRAQSSMALAPDPRTGVTALGYLCSISYVTRKAGDPKPEGQWPIYKHDFGLVRGRKVPRLEELPVLGFTYAEHPSGLVVIRGRSPYTVTARGIEG
jgi:hypothetical protein